ncbi:MAG TPA: hypothetical protein VFM02_00645 [Candidatus Paceibacterota bacterium]|nr:hypothetical protein [Candidatus Paceibacterota bacterium]
MSRIQMIVISVIILAALGVIAFVSYESYQSRSIQTAPVADANANEASTTSIELITAKHQYNADMGTHTVAGTLETPTICDILSTSVKTEKSVKTATATIAFKLTNTSETCAQAVGEQRFKVSFDAPENAVIQATLNGRPIQLNLVPVPKGENLDDFQIYVKG